jgi:hypothetical protein
MTPGNVYLYLPTSELPVPLQLPVGSAESKRADWVALVVLACFALCPAIGGAQRPWPMVHPDVVVAIDVQPADITDDPDVVQELPRYPSESIPNDPNFPSGVEARWHPTPQSRATGTKFFSLPRGQPYPFRRSHPHASCANMASPLNKGRRCARMSSNNAPSDPTVAVRGSVALVSRSCL